LDKNSKFPLYFYGVIIFFNIFFTAFWRYIGLYLNLPPS
jgi:hypothetical protein